MDFVDAVELGLRIAAYLWVALACAKYFFWG